MLHAALYLTVVLWVLSPLKALAFIAVQQAVFSLYLGISFAPNHNGMPIIESATAIGFARRQVVTARNISGGRVTTFILGGLNYQIGHHLFPSMPRPNLPRVQGLVRDFCAATDLGYREGSFAGSFRQIIPHLSDAGAASRVQAPLAPGGAARSSAAGGGDGRAGGRYPGARQTASTLLPSGSRTKAPVIARVVLGPHAWFMDHFGINADRCPGRMPARQPCRMPRTRYASRGTPRQWPANCWRWPQ
jgi:hypothetical protein